jgi:hypothetical protein
VIRDILRRFALCIDTFVLMNNTHFDGRRKASGQQPLHPCRMRTFTQSVILFYLFTVERTMSGKFSTAKGTTEEWKVEVLEKEKVAVCTKEAWTHVWTDPEGEHKDFDQKHLAAAEALPSGDVVVTIPWRFDEGRHYPKAGGPSHYMQFVYLKDESDTIKAIAKFEHSDEAFPWTFDKSSVAGAKTLTPYSIDCIHGVWKGESIPYGTEEL